jgi:signal transduction histidine kinase
VLRRLDLAAVAHEALESVRPAAAAKGVALHADMSGAPVDVPGDPDRLQQVIWNLLSNAVKFTPPGGSVRMEVTRTSDDDATIVVTDSGDGIPADFLPFVFDRFRQADASTTRSQGGLGLGLAVARTLVELHGGSIEAGSDGTGRGATFRVRLPAA